MSITAQATSFSLSGIIIDSQTKEFLSYANIKIAESAQFTISDEEGRFKISNIISGKIEIEITFPGYAQKNLELDLFEDTDLGEIQLFPSDLSLPEVEVVTKRKTNEGTTSYLMDRTVLDHAQVMNLSDIKALLPGGQTVNSSLMNDSRMALRAGSSESGNASFATAIEVDGVRLDNNANMEETLSASTRNLSSANIGSIEIVSGIPGVEYGDVANGMVKVNPRRGASPWIIEASINPYSKQIALIKGLSLPNNGGIFNFTLEHAQSFSNISSPHTSYKRNLLSINYNHIFFFPSSTLSLNASISGNIGGFKSNSDPDAFSDTYEKVRDNQIRGNIRVDWWKSNDNGTFKLDLQGAVVYSDKLRESYTNKSSSSSQPYLHTIFDGYNIAQEFSGIQGLGDIILGPTGYWYVKEFNDQKPLSLQLKAKGSWTKEYHNIINMLTLGADLISSSNKGDGIYYEDMALAPTWRPYVYNELPSLYTFAFFLEDKIVWKKLTLTPGIRTDISYIKNSAYGTVTTLSPRINASYDLLKTAKGYLNIYAGFGKGVKLPSFQILYPADSYSDKLIFTPGSTLDNRAFYAYYTHVSKVEPNKDLKWQSSRQIDLGLDAKINNFKFSLSAYVNLTKDPYQMVSIYSPISYHYTSQSALENCEIPSSKREYSIDPVSGIVTVTDKTNGSSLQLPYATRKTFVSNRSFINGSPVTRFGIEWMADFPILSQPKPVNLSLRVDGNFYGYKGVSSTLIAGAPNGGVGDFSAEAGVSPLIGYYSGSNITSLSNSYPSVSNGYTSRGCSVNTTVTMHIPKIKLIVTFRLESTFLNYKRNLANNEYAVLLKYAGDVFGNQYNGEKDAYVALYPQYYSTWENPTERIPFAESLARAYEEDPGLYNQLCNLIVRSNSSYYFNPQTVSPYFSANFSVTKEIGKWVSISIYANNFFNNMSFVRNSQTGLESSLFASGYIPRFYYGVALRIKI